MRANPEEILRLSKESEDERIRYIAATWVFERAWGKPRDFDPVVEKPERPKFDPRAYSPEELDVIEAGLRLMVEPRTVAAAPTGSPRRERRFSRS
jgi:hypothetical protein